MTALSLVFVTTPLKYLLRQFFIGAAGEQRSKAEGYPAQRTAGALGGQHRTATHAGRRPDDRTANALRQRRCHISQKPSADGQWIGLCLQRHQVPSAERS